MTKILRESEEKRKEREEMMDIHRAYIDSLPNPGKFIFSLLPNPYFVFPTPCFIQLLLHFTSYSLLRGIYPVTFL